MAKTSYVDVPSALEEDYFQSLQPSDRFIVPSMRKKSAQISRKKRKALDGRTYLHKCSELWAEMTDAEKQNWHDYDFHEQKHGWRRFVEEQSTRINLDLSGTATANQYHQDLVGKVLIESPQDEAKLIQPHPKSYWKKTKVVGKDSMFKPSKVTEALSLPLKIGLSYKTDLTSTSPDASAQFYALVRHLYQGQNLDYKLAIDLPLSGGWNKQTATLSDTAFDVEPKGKVVSYNLYISLYKVTGTLLFDHVLAQHSGSNWARDPFCDEVSRGFTKRFFQIPKHWYLLTPLLEESYFGSRNYGVYLFGGEDVSPGITYGSVYPG